MRVLALLKVLARLKVLALLPLLGVAACQTASLPGRAGPFEGAWSSADGIFVAAFADGAFTSRAVGQPERVLAQGRYTVVGPGAVRLDWFSQLQGTALSADCASQGRTTLVCTPSRGTPFTLLRGAQGR